LDEPRRRLLEIDPVEPTETRIKAIDRRRKRPRVLQLGRVARLSTLFFSMAAVALGAVHDGVPAVSASPMVFGTWVRTTDTSHYSPPSPDPAGIVYLAATDRFLISDSEVDEMSIYQGSSLYTGTRAGSGTGTGTTLPFSQEPSGLGYNPANGTLFISDDDRAKIFLDRPGPDGRYGSADDIVSSFSTSAFGSTDSEDVVYDPVSGHLFISDGAGLEVYDVNPVNGVFGDGNDVVTHFDIGSYGPRDAEGIGIDPQSDHLLVVDPSTKSIYELTKAGALVRIIDCHSVPETNRAYADVTMAPTSDPNDPPGRLAYWMVDRGLDNGGDPNENDGKLYEITAPPSVAFDTVPPTRPNVRGPRKTTRPRAAYRFSARDAVTPARKLRFLCALDRQRLRACGTRYVARLSRGRHVLRVAARDEAGNTSAAVAVRVRRR
jgi:hypothetical protein